MENYNYYEDQESKGSVVKGLIGALVGAILGGIVWGAVGLLTQRVFALLGLLLGFLVVKGYELLKGREGAVKLVIVIICVILSVVIGEAIYEIGMIEIEYGKMPEYLREELATMGYPSTMLTEDFLKSFIPEKSAFYEEVFADESFRKDALLNLGLALLFAALGAVGVIVGMRKQTQPQPQPLSAAADGVVTTEAPVAADETVVSVKDSEE